MGSIPTLGNKIFTYIYIFISTLWCRGKSATLSSATRHAMPLELGEKWETVCLNTRFPLPTLLCAEYSVKLIVIYLYYYIFFILMNSYGFVRDRQNSLYSLNLMTFDRFILTPFWVEYFSSVHESATIEYDMF